MVLAISSDDPALFANLFFAEVITGVNAVIEETDPALLLALRENDPPAKVAEAGGVPVVHGGRSLDRTPRWYVDADNRGGARQAVEHLISTGRRAIGTVTGPQDLHAGVTRCLGFREAVAPAGPSDHRVVHADFSEVGGDTATARFLDEHPDPDAVFVASDAMAAGALQVLRERGRAVPEDIAVVGFNDVLTARHTQPALTTVHQPIVALGREMTRMLVRVLDGEEPTPLILPTEPVIRGSA